MWNWVPFFCSSVAVKHFHINAHRLHLNYWHFDMNLIACSDVLLFAGMQHLSKLYVKTDGDLCACTLTMLNAFSHFSSSFFFSYAVSLFPFFWPLCCRVSASPDKPAKSVSGDALLPLQYVGRPSEGALLDNRCTGPYARTPARYVRPRVVGQCVYNWTQRLERPVYCVYFRIDEAIKQRFERCKFQEAQ